MTDTSNWLADAEAAERRRRREAAGGALMSARGIDPAAAAAAERAGAVLGFKALPVPSADLAEEARVQKNMEALSQAHRTAGWISDPNNAAVASDQVEPLSRFEALLHNVGGVVQNVRREMRGSLPETSSGLVSLFGAAQDVSDSVLNAPFKLVDALAGTSFVSDAERNRREAQAGYVAYLNRASDSYRAETDNNLARAAYSGVRSIIPSAIAVVASLATGSPAAGAAILAGSQAGQSYDEARSEGLGMGASLAYGGAQGGAEFFGERLGMAPLLKGLKMGSPFLQTFIKSQVAEQLGEQATTVMQDFNTWAYLQPEKSFGDYLAERPNAALETAIATAVGTGATNTLAYGAQRGAQALAGVADRRQAAAQAAATQMWFDGVREEVLNNELRKRTPERFQAYLNAVTPEGAQVIVPAEAVVTFFQSNPDLAEWMDEWDIRDQVEQAMVAGTDVVFDQATYLGKVVGTEADTAWANDLKHGERAMSVREAEAYEAEGELDLAEAFGRAVSEAQAEHAAQTPYDRVRADAYQQLRNTGMSDQEARLSALSVAERAAARAVRTTDYADAWEAYKADGGVTFQQQLPSSVQAVSDRLDLVIAAMQARDAGPTQRQLYGESLLEMLSQAGGIEDVGGDLASMGAAAWSNPRVAGRVGRSPIIRKPGSEPGAYGPDDALTRAIEGGYLKDGASVEDLFEAIRSELAGQSQYSADFTRNSRAEETLQAADDLAEMLGQAGINPATATPAQIRAFVAEQSEAQVETQASYDQSAPALDDDRNLVAVHNLSEANLLNVAKVGGLAVPSVAVVRGDHVFPNFGEITLVAPPSLVDPKENKAAKVFGADVYSPRYPRAKLELDDKARAALEKRLKPSADALGEYLYLDTIEEDGLDVLDGQYGRLGRIVRHAFLAERGDTAINAEGDVRAAIETRIGELRAEFDAWREGLTEGLVKRERIFDGYTPSGRRKYLDHNLDNVVKILKRGLRDGEAYDYGVGSIRSKVTPQFKSLKAIRAAKDRLVGAEEMQALKDEADQAFIALGERLQPKLKWKSDAGYLSLLSEHVKEVADTRRASSLDAYYDGLTDDDRRAVVDFLERLRTMPTEYFEAKIQRAVGLDEFVGAVVPSTISDQARKVLTDAGLRVVEYDKGDTQAAENAARMMGVQAFRDDTFFQSDTPFTGPRGQVQFGATGAVVTFFKSRDRSTFTHEMGHKWLDELFTDEKLSGATEQVRQDAQTVRDWFASLDGVEALAQVRQAVEAAERKAQKSQSEADVAMAKRMRAALSWAEANGRAKAMQEVGRTFGENAPSEHRAILTMPYHEWFARGFERFLMEGQAPSLELRSVFLRFADWMKAIYKNVLRLNAPISDPVRGVMSRLLATDEQIEAVREVQHLNRLFADNKAAGMTKGDFAALTRADNAAWEESRAKAYKSAMEPLRREAMASWKAEREALRPEREAIVDAQPDIAALRLLSETGQKLNRQALIDLAGTKEVLKLLPNRRPAIYGAEGLHPDDLAERVGLRSGDELLSALIAHEKERQNRKAKGDNRAVRDARIEDALDAEMTFLHGDPMTDGTLEDVATQAVHEKLKAKHLAMEATQLATLAGREALWTQEGIEAFAQATIDNLKALKINPATYLRAERSAGLRAQRALLKGDHSSALDAKLLQAVNFQLYRTAVDAQQEVSKAEDLFFKVINAKDATTAKARNFDMVNAARSILSAYGVVRNRGMNAEEYLKAIEAYDPDAYAALKQTVDDAVVGAAELDTLTLTDFRELATVIDQLWTLSRRSQVVEIEGRRVEAADARAEMAADLAARRARPGKRGMDRAVTDKERRFSTLLSIRSFLGKVEEWAIRQGPAFTRYIYRPISEGAEAYRTLARTHMPTLQRALETLRPDINKPFKIQADEIGYTFGENGGNGIVELIGALRHVGNPSNYQKLLLGRGWGTLNPDGTLNDSGFKALLARLHAEGVLQKRHWDYVQAEWDLHETIKPHVQRAHRRMTGSYFAEVTAAPVDTPFGTYAGGYVPAKVDPELHGRAAEFDLQGLLANGANGSFIFPGPANGFTKARNENFNKPLDLDLRKALTQFDEVMRYAMIGPAAQDVGRLLREQEFADLLNDYDPGVWNDFLRPWLERSVSQRTLKPSEHPFLRSAENVVGVITKRSAMSIMFANVINTAQQFTGFSPAMIRTGKRNMAQAMRDYLSDPITMTRQVSEMSPMMANRMGSEMRDLAQEARRITLAPGPYGRAVEWSDRHMYFMQKGVQNFMDPIVWTAAYNRALERGERNPVAYADMVVRTTQDSYNPEDASTFSTGSKLAAPFKMFTGYFIGQANLIATEGTLAWRERDYARMVEIYVLGVFVTAVGSELIVQALRGTLGDEGEDGWWDDLADLFIISQIRYAAAFIPFVGQGVNYGLNLLDDKPYNDRLSVSPVIGVGDTAGRAVIDLKRIADGRGDASNTVKDFGTVVSVSTGLPTLPRQTGYLADVLEGDVEPLGPVDAMRGFLSGAASEASKVN